MAILCISVCLRRHQESVSSCDKCRLSWRLNSDNTSPVVQFCSSTARLTADRYHSDAYQASDNGQDIADGDDGIHCEIHLSLDLAHKWKLSSLTMCLWEPLCITQFEPSQLEPTSVSSRQVEWDFCTFDLSCTHLAIYLAGWLAGWLATKWSLGLHKFGRRSPLQSGRIN